MKRNNLLYVFVFSCLITILSCKKELKPEGVASLTIINALPGCQSIVTNFSNQYEMKWYSSALRIYYGEYNPSNRLSITAKELPVTLYHYPDTTAQDKPLYQLTLNPSVGEISTLFLTGTLAKPEKLLVTAKPTYYSAKDSLMGLRFVNLSYGSDPVEVRISGQGISLKSSNLNYKGITDYLSVSATSNVGDVLVEFYDQVSGNLLGSYTLTDVGAPGTTQNNNKWLYRSYTVALKGLPNAANPEDAQGVFLVYDY